MPASPQDSPRSQFIAQITCLVREYDQAIAFFTQKLGFSPAEDAYVGGGITLGRRSPTKFSRNRSATRTRGNPGANRLHRQPGRRPRLSFSPHKYFQRDHSAMLANGIRFLESPRSELYGTVAVFEDLYGNKWDLLEPAAQAKEE